MTTLCLVDLSAIFFWRWAAAAAKPVGTAYEETVGRVRQLAERFPRRTTVCCDSGRSFRYEIDPEYKAKRPPKDQAAVEQLALVCEELTKLGLPLLKADGFEGDDVIATVTTAALTVGPEVNVVIAGQDKDLLALIGPRVSLLHVQHGNSWGPAEVKAKFKVEPGQMRDYLALVGDSSDNIKGVAKIGDVNAARLLAEFGSVEKLIASLDAKDEAGAYKVKPDAIRKSLMDNLGSLDVAMRLVTLRTDAPLECAALFSSMRLRDDARSPEASAPSEPAPPPPPRPTYVTRPMPPPRDEGPTEDIARARAAAPTCPTTSSLIRSSPWINHLAAALAAAQGEFDTIEKDRTAQIRSDKGNFSYGYATLASVLSAVRPALAKHGLAVAQVVSEGALVTRIMHSSGQWIEGDVPMRLDMSRPQAAGSLLTYFRRYALSALLCVAPDEDDDGASASAHAH